MELFQIMQLLDRKSLMIFLGEKPAQDILMAYESAYGSVQKFAYERDILKCVVDEYLSSGEEQQMAFCNCLEFGVSSHSKVFAKGTDKVIAKAERDWRLRCFFNSLFRKKNIAESLRRQYGITEKKGK